MTTTCDCDKRPHRGDFPLLLTHHADCWQFGIELRVLVEGLVDGMEAWAADEDGIHPDALEAYEMAKLSLGEPMEEGGE